MEKQNFFQKNKIWLIVFGILLIFLILFISKYNTFVTLDQDVNGKWSEAENQYQRQADLIPNLISVVSSSVKIETNLIKEVTESRTKWQNSKTLFEKDFAGAEMNNGITALINAVATSENYPVLQANKQYIALTDELSGTQNRITVARGRYIESIQKYNTAIKRFPGNLFADLYGFSEKEYYKAELDSLKTPEIGSGQLP